MTQTVLVAGGTGMLGSRIAHHLLAEPDVRVRLLARGGAAADPAKQASLAPLLGRGASVIDGDLADPASLDRATRGVDVVVSAVQGGPEVIIEGQLALLSAAKGNGVRRILPSDFAVDLFEAPEGDHMLLDMRRTADKAIAASGLEHVHVLNGAFMDVLTGPYFEVFDVEDGTARFWGGGDERFDVTSVEDTARYTAKAALDRELESGRFAIAAEQLSFEDAIKAIEAATGRIFERERRGSIDDLRVWIADKRAGDPDPFAPIAATYQLYMLTGQTALRDLQNGRYPGVTPESYAAFARRSFAPKREA